MITVKQEDRIISLLHSGKYAQQDIADRCEVSRVTVSAVANGTLHAAHRAANRQKVTANGSFIRPHGLLIRCPGCGGMVQMPYLSCYLACGEKYPDSVMALYRHPAVRLTAQKCIRCNKTKTTKVFRGDIQATGCSHMHFHTCASCRSELTQLTLPRKKIEEKN